MMTVKLLWKGAECWADCLRLLSVAESTLHSKELDSEMDGCQNMHEFVVLRRSLAVTVFFLVFLPGYSLQGLFNSHSSDMVMVHFLYF